MQGNCKKSYFYQFPCICLLLVFIVFLLDPVKDLHIECLSGPEGKMNAEKNQYFPLGRTFLITLLYFQ